LAVTGFTGISHPFRLNARGGIATSTTTSEDVAHINESIVQILNTKKLERSMEYHIYSELDEQVFEPNDMTTHSLIKYNVENALKLEPRIEVRDVQVIAEDNFIYVDITYLVLLYQQYYNTGRIKVGEI